MAARCAGLSAAMKYCAMASQEFPVMPILPFDQACAPAHSMTS
jgi:hypothetical protein